MKNIGIRVHATDGQNGVCGYASITLAGQLAVTGIKIRSGQYGRFLCMPSRIVEESPQGKKYGDIFYPVNKDIRKDLTADVLAVLDRAEKEQSKTATQDVTATPLPLDIGVSLKEGNTKEKANVTIKIGGNFYLEGVTVRYLPDEDRYFVCMPSYKAKDGDYKNYAYPVTSEYREAFNTAVLGAFEKEMNKAVPAPSM